MNIKEGIEKLIRRQNLNEQEMIECMREIMDGNTTPAQIASFITALRMKGETVDEITGAARVMREKCIRIKPSSDVVLDTCGTGGDFAHTVNISTLSAFVAAGAGIVVAKHGNRSVTSKCGSADVLKELKVNIETTPEVAERCLNEIGIAFIFAPLFHPAMKHAIGPRREIGIRTIFNILGPLTNPAGAKYQLLGVYDPALTDTLAHVLKRFESKRAMVVHGDGLDEITITGTTKASELKDGKVLNYLIDPEKFGLKKYPLAFIKGGEPAENAKIMLNVLKGENGPATDATLLNAGAAIMIAGAAKDMQEGMERARESIRSGRALEKLNKLIHLTNQE
jgi:anthranilate phosphoribosyltransferase